MNCNTKLNKHWNTPPVLCRSLILVALAAITPGWAAATEAGEATVAYQAKGDLLTIQANNVSLRKVLAQISGSTGIQVSMPPVLDRPVTLTTTRSTAEVLKQLLRGNNYAMAYEEDGRVRRLAKVTILPKGQEGGVDTLAPEAQSSPAVSRVYSKEERTELKRRQALRESRGPAANTHGPRAKEQPGLNDAGTAAAGKE